MVAGVLLSLAFVIWSTGPTPHSGVDPLVARTEESRYKGRAQGHPDLFLQYYHDIRASSDGTNDYPMGYRFTEYYKALDAAKNSGTKLNWVERGPGNVGGRTRPILVDPEDPRDTWWAGSVSGGLWKTTDRGRTWQPLTDDLPTLAVNSLAMAESDPNVIYMGTGEGVGYFSSVAGDGVFKSVNRGATWDHLLATSGNPDFRFVNRLAVDPTNPDVVLAATPAGVFRTVNGGESWDAAFRTTSEYEWVDDLRAKPGEFSRQIAGVSGRGIIHSKDAGLSWSYASADLEPESFGRIELAYSPSSPDIAYAAVNAWTSEGDFRFLSDLYLSKDAGMNWERTATYSDINWFGPQGWFNNTLAVHPFSPDTVYVGGIHLWRNSIVRGLVVVNDFDFGGSDEWLAFRHIYEDELYFRKEQGIYADHPFAVEVSPADYTDIEIRWGQGTQLAHRFWVSENSGLNGTTRVPIAEYIYGGYVEVPFQVWDTENSRQLMVSFRDQADDGEFTLIPFFFDWIHSPRNVQSLEYLFVHKYEYDGASPHESISRDGGWVHGLLYMMWPVLANSEITWTPTNLPSHTVSVSVEIGEYPGRELDDQTDPDRNTHVDHHNILPIPIDESRNEFWLLDANDGGVALSTDNGRNYRELDEAGSGYNTMQVYGVAKKPGASEYVAGSQDNGTWRSPGNPNSKHAWVESGPGDGFETVWHATDPNRILISAQLTSIGRSVDGGASWHPSLDAPNPQFYTQVASSDKAPDNVYSVTSDGVWYTRDFGETWDLTTISSPYWEPWTFARIEVSVADPSIVWTGYGMISEPGDRQVLNKVHVSRDRGESFEPTSFPLMQRPPEAYISGLATHPIEPGTAYALFSRSGHPKVLETKDFGQTWTDLSGFASSNTSTNGFPDVAVFDLVVIPHAPSVLWAGTEIGLFESRDYGARWHYADNGLPAVPVWQIKIRDGEAILGTHGRGVWTVPILEVAVGIAEEADAVPATFGLDQNYPNPFNASTTIEFRVPKRGQIRLTVFDALGRKAAILTDQVYAPGVHRLKWRAGAFASGMYFYRMESEGQPIQTRRMTLYR